MKTAVSIPDSLFDAAEELAAKLRLNRSELYALAIHELVQRRTDREAALTRRVNAMCEKLGEDNGVDADIKTAQAKEWRRETW